MISFLSGKVVRNVCSDLFGKMEAAILPKNWQEGAPRQFSEAASAVFEAGRVLWRYYHTTAAVGDYNVNASLYDIREYFQRRDSTGRMNNASNDARYMELIINLRSKLQRLAAQIESKVYEYGFLKEE
ncbi:MAG: hypothetical protein LBR06_08870 [Bacteroidales bacterium]|jgi:hypothetical protein|nr:hypothetical protein [Bacteroidales bacterium]